MSYSSVEAHAKEYFWSLSPLAKRVASDVAAARDAYEDLWITLSLSDQRQVLDDAIIRPEAALKYSFCPRGRPPVEYYPRLRIHTGGRIVSEEDGKITWRDEHSAPFSFMTRSQLNLTLTGNEQQVRDSPRKQAEGFIDPPSVVLGGSSKRESPVAAGFLDRLKNKSAVLKIQALGRAPDRQPLLSPDSIPTPAPKSFKPSAPAAKTSPKKPMDFNLPAAKTMTPKAMDSNLPAAKTSPPKAMDSNLPVAKTSPKAMDFNLPAAKTSSPKAMDFNLPAAKTMTPKPMDSNLAVAKTSPPKAIDLTLPAAKLTPPKAMDCKPAGLKEVAGKGADGEAGRPVKASKPAEGKAVSPRRKPRTPPPPPPGRDPERARLLPGSPDELEDLGDRPDASRSMDSLQEFHSALNSPTGSSDSVPKTGFDFLDNW